MDERADAVSGHESTTDIRRDIDRTQREMSHTIDEIQYRLSPDHLKEQAKQSMKQSFRRARVNTSRNTIDRVKANPIGAALVGVGLWMLLRNNDADHSDPIYYLNEDYDHGRGYELGHDYEREHSSHRMAEMKDRVSGVADNVRDTASDMASRAAERAHMLRERTMYGARGMSSRGRDLMTDTPLVAGIAAMAVGAIIGAMIPETDRENALFGDKRDELASKAADVARQGMDHARDIAASAVGAAKDAATREAKAAKDDMTQNLGV
jgi:hypothetical protein